MPQQSGPASLTPSTVQLYCSAIVKVGYALHMLPSHVISFSILLAPYQHKAFGYLKLITHTHPHALTSPCVAGAETGHKILYTGSYNHRCKAKIGTLVSH